MSRSLTSRQPRDTAQHTYVLLWCTSRAVLHSSVRALPRPRTTTCKEHVDAHLLSCCNVGHTCICMARPPHHHQRATCVLCHMRVCNTNRHAPLPVMHAHVQYSHYSTLLGIRKAPQHGLPPRVQPEARLHLCSCERRAVRKRSEEGKTACESVDESAAHDPAQRRWRVGCLCANDRGVGAAV